MWRPTSTDRSGPRYLAIAAALEEDVASGALSPGTRLPTHRELADRLGVTVGTVSRAYAEAARRGLVTGEVGRGTFVGGPREEAREVEGPEAPIDLAQNHPPEPAAQPHRAALATSLAALTRQAGFGRLLNYPAAGGNAADREAGAAWVARAGVAAAPEQVLVCTGSQHGLAVVLATLLQPGDLLLTESLTYAGLKSVAGLLHLKVAGLPVDAHGLQPDAFEAACRKREARALYLIPTLHNPTTAVMPLERRREIAAIAERHGVAIVEDDVHGLLPERRPPPLAALAPERTYFLTSTSKTLAPGLRIAYVLAPARMVPRLTDSLRATTWAVAPLTAAVASSWINSGTADAILAARRGEARARQSLAREVLAGADLDAQPEAYYLWLRLPEPWRRDSFAAVLRARGVELTPADAFAVGRGPAPHAVRLCLGAARSRDTLRRGLVLVADVLQGAGEAGGAVI
ncbi:MAG: PLP-dependent aminotransferase family protein [Acidobacteria bacterium]|jgi:DNA-binding transcriptional MocR family regulator|nr:PLP-dependent aminotransferase family protein [Acidobacteriota bacterium]